MNITSELYLRRFASKDVQYGGNIKRQIPGAVSGKCACIEKSRV